MRARALILVGLLSFVTRAGALQPVMAPPAISGRVIAPDGSPVASGSVALMVSSMNRVTAAITRDGEFRITPDRADRQALFIAVPGFAPYRANVTVPPSRAMKLPDIQLRAATYYRVQLIAADGDQLGGRGVKWRTLDADGATVPDPLQLAVEQTEADGTITIGPLPIGRTIFAFDRAPLAQTRLRDAVVNGGSRSSRAEPSRSGVAAASR
jgi:hypothetical protein